MGSADPWVAMRAMYETATTNAALIDEFAQYDATYLMQFNTGPVQLICREPIDEVADFEGKRIRAVGPYIEAFTQLGAEIVSFPAIEVYQALDSGLMDCSQVYWSNVGDRFPPRTRAKENSQRPEDHLEAARDCATIEAIRLQKEEGLDIITDREIRQEGHSDRFATAPSGVDIANPGTGLDRSGHPNPPPA